MILDTAFLLDLKDGDPDAFGAAVELFDAGVVQRVALPSVWELQYDVTYSGSAAEERVVRNLLRMYPIEPLTESVVKDGASRLADVDREVGGTSGVAIEDALIGAVGVDLDEPVLTRDVDDFGRLGVAVETY